MKYLLRGVLVMVAGLVIWSSCGQKAPTEIKWASSLDEAFQLASKESHPIIAEFWSDG